MTWRDPAETAHLDDWRDSYDRWKCEDRDDNREALNHWMCLDCGAHGVKAPGQTECPRCKEREERKAKWTR